MGGVPTSSMSMSNSSAVIPPWLLARQSCFFLRDSLVNDFLNSFLYSVAVIRQVPIAFRLVVMVFPLIGLTVTVSYGVTSLFGVPKVAVHVTVNLCELCFNKMANTESNHLELALNFSFRDVNVILFQINPKFTNEINSIYLTKVRSSENVHFITPRFQTLLQFEGLNYSLLSITNKWRPL